MVARRLSSRTGGAGDATSAPGHAGKSIPQVGQELWDMVVTYARQETIEPIKGLGRFIAFGVAGSLLLGLGTVLLILAGLRALQTETGTNFTGNLTWVPYLITFVGTVIVIVWAASRIGKGRKKP